MLPSPTTASSWSGFADFDRHSLIGTPDSERQGSGTMSINILQRVFTIYSDHLYFVATFLPASVTLIHCNDEADFAALIMHTCLQW